MECNLGWNQTRDFKIERARSASSIWNHKYDFRPKLHNTKFNYHFITSILKSPKYRTSNILLPQYWASFKLNSSIFGRKKNKPSSGNKSCKICHMTLHILHLPAIWLVTLNKPWSLIGCFVFSVASIVIKQKMVQFVNKLHQLEPIRLQGPPVISKWV